MIVLQLPPSSSAHHCPSLEDGTFHVSIRSHLSQLQQLLTVTDDGVTLVIWGNAEAAVTIMAASMPMLRMLFRSVRPSRRRHHSSHRSARSRRHLVDTGSSKRVYYYNKPRKDLVTMSGSTWFSDTHFTGTNHTRNASVSHTRNASASRSRP